jgi:Predicted hydrolases or acyltransferases (alpha/beta hydrolase superfamily)
MNGIALKRIGARGGPPLVLLYGFGGTMATWDAVVPLVGTKIDIVLADLPGHGDSLHADGRGGAGRMAKALLAALSAAGIERFHLAGHSMGGAVAMLMALREPPRVLSLSLVAPGGMAPEIDATLLGEFAGARTPEAVHAVLKRMVAPAYAWDDAAIAAVAASRDRPGAVEALTETYVAMFPDGPERGQGTLPRGELEKLTMPVGLLWGDADTVLPHPRPDGVPANFRLTTIAGAGHMLPEEVPQAVADLISQTAGLPA